MSRRASNPWLKLGFDTLQLGMEASMVIGLRTLRIAAGGPAGEAEVRRMIGEKIGAGLELQALALRGAVGPAPDRMAAASLAHVRRKVRANHRRLVAGG
ncbi:MAG: hypothetical protein K1X35_03470 [Caulobacteraceae bacterium]|nr:hypothetical protein [Caulobacteraceae bacterium]